MDVAGIAESLGLSWSGSQWRGPCPVHGGTGGAFALSEKDDGSPLVHCFAGCSFRDIRDELHSVGLWPETDRKPATPEQRRRRKLQRKRAEAQRIVDKFESMPLSVRQDIEPEVFDAEWLRYERARALLAMEEP